MMATNGSNPAPPVSTRSSQGYVKRKPALFVFMLFLVLTLVAQQVHVSSEFSSYYSTTSSFVDTNEGSLNHNFGNSSSNSNMQMERLVEQLQTRLELAESELVNLRKTMTTTSAASTKESTTTTTTDTKKAPNELPTCRDLMQQPNSPLANGDFLTQEMAKVQWTPLADGSRRLDLLHPCQLHRYTPDQARHCLAGQHLNFIGDSVTRYQYLSLVHLVHLGVYPPRFRMAWPCKHLNEKGEPTCSPLQEPSVCAEGDWRNGPQKAGYVDAWDWILGEIGGGHGMPNPKTKQGGLFDGHLECSCARLEEMKCKRPLTGLECATENELYISPPLERFGNQRIILSSIGESGFGSNPVPIKGFNFTRCAWDGSCRRQPELSAKLALRAQRNDFDFFLSLPEALNGTFLKDHGLPPVDISFYNRGLWGPLSKERSAVILPLLYDFVGGENGRCFFRTTTASSRDLDPVGRGHERLVGERSFVRMETFRAGCSFFDIAHVTESFAGLPFVGKVPNLSSSNHFEENITPNATERANASATTPTLSVKLSNYQERQSIFWDAVHFQPWVYEEINNLMLNVLCNLHPLE